jgi:azurin
LFQAGAQDNANGQPLSISIKAIPGLQYDLVRFVVQPGAKVTITLANTDDMSHNLLITRPGARMEVVTSAMQLAAKGPERNFIPANEQVLWSIPVLSPGQVKSLTFKAPSDPGVYPYVCTYPGHGFVMFGAMYVIGEGQMPDISTDVNIPESRRKDSTGAKHEAKAEHVTENSPGHPYALTPPYLYRVFVDGGQPCRHRGPASLRTFLLLGCRNL